MADVVVAAGDQEVRSVHAKQHRAARAAFASHRSGCATRGHVPFTGCVRARRQTVEVPQPYCGGVEVERSKKLEEALEVRIPAPGKVPMILAMKQE